MTDAGYNGHANWATWFVSSTIENVEDWYREAQRIVARTSTDRELREYVEGLFFGEIVRDAHHTDVATQEASQDKITRAEFEQVDWDEVRESLDESTDDEDDEDDEDDVPEGMTVIDEDAEN